MSWRFFPAMIFVGLMCGARALADAPAPRVFDIAALGAIADGKTPATSAIQASIDACSAAGGGQVRIPAGNYLSGPFHLANGVDLHIEAGATVLFSTNWSDYPLANGTGERVRVSPISGENLHDISITGGGAFDGQGQAWRPVKQGKLSTAKWHALIGSGGFFDRVAQIWYPTVDMSIVKQRPVLVYLANCRHVVLEGPAFRNSPNWDVHLLLSDDVAVRHVSISNPAYAQNGDGIDIDSCSNVNLSDSTINAGDDAICVKATAGALGGKPPVPSRDIDITNCTIGTGHGGITIGSETSGGVRDVSVSHCRLDGTDAGLRFKTARGHGGVVENIQVSDISMSHIHQNAIEFDMFYGEKHPPNQSKAVDTGTPQFHDFQISNISCDDPQTALLIRGLPEMPIRRITLQNIRITAHKSGEVDNADDLTLRNIQISASDPGPVVLKSVQHLITDNVQGLSDSR
jgi:DNA sulfur modification protein DndE